MSTQVKWWFTFSSNSTHRSQSHLNFTSLQFQDNAEESCQDLMLTGHCVKGCCSSSWMVFVVRGMRQAGVIASWFSATGTDAALNMIQCNICCFLSWSSFSTQWRVKLSAFRKTKKKHDGAAGTYT